MSNPKERPGPKEYLELFETDRRGARILEDLILRFSRKPPASTGIDRILDIHEFMGQRKVIDFIANQINQANNVQPTEGE